MRRLIKQALAACLYYSGILKLVDWLFVSLRGKPDTCVLMYHRVIDDPFALDEYTQAGISVSTKSFEKQIRFLAKRFEIISTTQHVQNLNSRQSVRRRTIVITFDDGWRDNITNAYPILKAHSAPATIYVCTDFVGTNRKFWFHVIGYYVLKNTMSAKAINEALNEVVTGRTAQISDHLTGRDLLDRLLAEIKAVSPEAIEMLIRRLKESSRVLDADWDNLRFTANWDELRSLDPAVITIGSHGCSHKLLTVITKSEAEKEISESKRTLESKLATKIESFAYPNGDFNDTIKGLVAAAEYKSAYAVGEGYPGGDALAIGRVGIHEGSALGIGNAFSPAIFALLLSPTVRRLKSRQRSNY